MSTNIFKAGIVVPLPHVTAENALGWFTEHFGEPSYVDDPPYFGYGHISVVRPYRDEPYKVAVFFTEQKDYGTVFACSLAEMQAIVNTFAKACGVDPSTVVFTAYEYYNGTDDPIHVDEIKYNTGDSGYDMRQFPEGLFAEGVLDE